MHLIEGEAFERDEVCLDNRIGIAVGLTGTLKGQVMISFSEEVSKKIASHVMGGLPIITIDDTTKATLVDMSNTIIGTAVSSLYNFGIALDVTPPVTIWSKEAIYSLTNYAITSIPLISGEEIIELNIVIKK